MTMDGIPITWYKTPMDVSISGHAGQRILRTSGFTTGWRSLPWLTVQMVFSGTYSIEHGGGREVLPAGSVWFVPLGCRHCHRVDGRVPAETAWWHGEVQLHGAVDVFASHGTPRLLPGGVDGEVGQALQCLLALPDRAGLAGILDRQAHMAAIAAALVAAVGGMAETPAGTALAAVFRFVDANLHLPLTRSELAARAGLSPSRFHELFLALTGTAPMAWVRRRRLARAAGLLTDTSMGMAEIASRVGLCDPYHLNKRFRAAYGLPPTRFRRQAHG
jgi:AraC family transcriptional regulator, arabinose operon regulatory protein